MVQSMKACRREICGFMSLNLQGYNLRLSSAGVRDAHGTSSAADSARARARAPLATAPVAAAPQPPRHRQLWSYTRPRIHPRHLYCILSPFSPLPSPLFSLYSSLSSLSFPLFLSLCLNVSILSPCPSLQWRVYMGQAAVRDVI